MTFEQKKALTIKYAKERDTWERKHSGNFTKIYPKPDFVHGKTTA
eukprot:CAMPEP_0115033510 /NCGR_PEP_ID=MMETSP0216-20121206/39958_1 /TAXON_ID=223996 /ORGANISM="Protocruzia adherens, Strain Boccale" /LENGTH=44 /DNA_ID= /DNA_START= /DNA_END= /DNA_ORIENTATION=